MGGYSEKCPYCPKWFQDPAALQQHTKSHGDVGRYLRHMISGDSTLADVELRVMAWAELNGLYVEKLQDELIIGKVK